jgi:hypothetical protein
VVDVEVEEGRSDEGKVKRGEKERNFLISTLLPYFHSSRMITSHLISSNQIKYPLPLIHTLINYFITFFLSLFDSHIMWPPRETPADAANGHQSIILICDDPSLSGARCIPAKLDQK